MKMTSLGLYTSQWKEQISTTNLIKITRRVFTGIVLNIINITEYLETAQYSFLY